LEIAINGSKFILTYTAAANRGKMDVYIDTVKVATLNMYSGATIWQKKWTSPNVSPGVHMVQLVHFSGAYVDIDAITIPDGVPPAPIINLGGSSGPTAGTVTLTWDAVGDDGITGTATSYEVRFSNTPISTETLWSAATPVITGIPTPAPFPTSQTMTVSGLFPGSIYYFSVRAKDEAGNLGGLSNSPGLEATNTAPLVVGKHDDSDPNIVYMGNWTYYPSYTPVYNKTLHLAKAITTGEAANNQVLFKFTGTGFILTYSRAVNRGKIDIYIDGSKVHTLDMYWSTTLWQQKWDSSTISPSLPYGTHTVRFVQVYVNATRIYIDVDGIEIKP
jgi:hypothetical protein